MSLITDLETIDLSGIVNARASISVSVQAPGLQDILAGGAAEIALSDLGANLSSLTSSIGGPEDLLQPLADGLSSVTGLIGDVDFPIEDYLSSIDETRDVLDRLLAILTSDPTKIGSLFGFSLGEGMESAQKLISTVSAKTGERLPQLTDLLRTADTGIPIDPKLFTNFAIDALLPFPKDPIVRVRATADDLFGRLSAIVLPTGRTEGLRLSLEALVVEARTGTEASITAALADLEQARAHTIAQLRTDLRGVLTAIGGLRVPDLGGEIARAIPDLRGLDDGVLDFLGRIRDIIAQAKDHVATFDPAEISAIIDRSLDELEAMARPVITAAIDEAYGQLESFVRGLFAKLGLRRLRNRLTKAIHGVAKAIHDARLDRFAVEAKAKLDELSATLANAGGLPAQIQAGLQEVEQRIDEAAGGILDALDAISAEIQAVAGAALGPLESASKALEDFQKAIDGAQSAIDRLGIERAGDEVVETLRSLRETAETVLSVTPLPEPLRPTVEQLIDLVASVDVSAALEPARSAAEQITIPAELADEIRAVLEQVADKLENLIPASLVADIDAEVQSVITQLESFDPASLLPDVGQYLEAAADQVRALKPPDDVVAAVGAPYEALLAALDALHPDKLLAPVIEGYDAMLGAISIPTPEVVAAATASLLESSGNAMASSMKAPATGLVGGDAGSSRGAGASTPAPAGGAGTVQPTDDPTRDPFGAGVRPGDVVRFFGYLPSRLRAALQAVERSEAGQALAELDRHTAGLARDLRGIPARVWDVERDAEQWLRDLLEPIRQLQVRAMLALNARVQAGELSASVDLSAVMSSSSASLYADMEGVLGDLRSTIRDLLTGEGSPGRAVEGIAQLLEKASITRLTGDLDAFLAALDPEPIAIEMDGLAGAVLAKTPEVLGVVGDDLRAAVDRLRALIEELNPGAQIQRFVRIFSVVKDELDLLNPRRLAAELGEVHAAIRAALVAYDPAALAQELGEVTNAAADGILSLDPATLLGDVSFLSGPVDRIRQANPATALASVGVELTEVGDRLSALDPRGLIESVNGIGPRVIDEMEESIEGIQAEVIALLESLRFAMANASASVSVSASIG